MGATYKNNIELTIFGESHGKAIGITIGNLPSGIQIDLDEVSRDMKRRAPGQNKMSTARKEADQVEILSGLQDGITTGAPLTGVIYNSDQHSKDYSLLKTNMRPGHSDYPAYIKYKGFNDVRGGGHFSGRITAPIVFAGNIAKQILKQKGIIIGAHILSIGKIKDEKFPVNVDDEMLLKLSEKQYPTIKEDVFEKMEETILKAKENLDSVGGKIECVALHVPAGVGEPFFDSLESHLSSLMFSIPAVKSVSFGDGESIDEMLGSEANDCYYYDEEGNVTKSTDYALANPKIVSYTPKQSYLKTGEACLSVPEDVKGYVPRHAKITVEGFDVLTNKDVKIVARGFLAICLQHELDHFDGVLYYDHINKEYPLVPIENAMVIE